MSQENFCTDCSESHNCSEVYRKLGHIEGPSVAAKVVVAFLVPIGTFIASLGACERFLAGRVPNGEIRTILSFGIGVAVTGLVMIAIRASGKSSSKKS